MARHFPHLEILAQSATKARTRNVPLLFVHGGYCDAWCWKPFFMPWFAARGHDTFAVSLRGHGGSDGHETLFGASVDDYAADVLRAMRDIAGEPVLIGHSMGAAVIERILERHPLRAAALLAPVPPSGLVAVAARMMTRRPDYLVQMARFDRDDMAADVLAALRPFYFTDDMDASLLREAGRHLWPESSRALFDLSVRLPMMRRVPAPPLFVLGAANDVICPPADVRQTARNHGVEGTIVDGLAHMLMLVPGWERAAAPLARWIDSLGKVRDKAR
jgi:pimeloyl-ACP methyl ester carboxylesterase